MACGILVPQSGIEPVPAALVVQSLNHWTTREVPLGASFVSLLTRAAGPARGIQLSSLASEEMDPDTLFSYCVCYLENFR